MCLLAFCIYSFKRTPNRVLCPFLKSDCVFVLVELHEFFPGGLEGKVPACNAGNLGLISGLGRSPGGGHGNPLQYAGLESPRGRRSLIGCSPWGCKESDTTERLSTAHRFVIAFLPRSKCLLILWLQSPSAVILEPKKINKICHCFHFFPSICCVVMRLDVMILVFLMLGF